jgi:hypothetical protein
MTIVDWDVVSTGWLQSPNFGITWGAVGLVESVSIEMYIVCYRSYVDNLGCSDHDHLKHERFRLVIS